MWLSGASRDLGPGMQQCLGLWVPAVVSRIARAVVARGRLALCGMQRDAGPCCSWPARIVSQFVSA